MLDVFNFPTPQGVNYQEFYGKGGSTGYSSGTWTKPRGASMVRFMLIGAGGGGGNGTSTQGGGGGGSGAITSWIGPAIFIPDVLIMRPAVGGQAGSNPGQTQIIYQAKNGTGYILLTANGGTSGDTTITGGAGGTAMTNNFFGAAGIFTSIAGQAGANGSATGAGLDRSAPSTTFLSAGAGGAGGSAGAGGASIPNYGYPTPQNATAGGTVKGSDGYFITQPILVGCGGGGGTTSGAVGTVGGKGGIGCGGGGSGEDGVPGSTQGLGGDGAVFVWAW